MADKAISDLEAASSIGDNDLFVLQQDNTAKKLLGSLLKAYITGVGGIDHITLNADYTLTVYYTNGTRWTSGSIRGAKGDTGDRGETGATGATGATGKTAYASAQDGGYQGTEEKFNSDLATVSSKVSVSSWDASTGTLNLVG